MTLQDKLRQVSRFYIDGRQCSGGNVHIAWACESEEAADLIDDLTSRVAALEAALARFAVIDGVAVPRMKVPPEQDRLWSYYDSRNDKQYEITRAHIIEAARVLKTQEK